MSLLHTGCINQDARLFDEDKRSHWYGAWFVSWRAGVWRQLVATPLKVRTRGALPENVTGFPVPNAADAELLSQLDAFSSDEEIALDLLLLALAHPTQNAAHRLRRLRRYAITGINISLIRHVPRIDGGLSKTQFEEI